MLTVPLQPVTNQKLTVIINQINYDITLRSMKRLFGFREDNLTNEFNYALYFTLKSDSISIVDNVICEDRVNLVNNEYSGIDGNFRFIDLQGKDPPYYTGLGTRYILIWYNNLS